MHPLLAAGLQTPTSYSSSIELSWYYIFLCSAQKKIKWNPLRGNAWPCSPAFAGQSSMCNIWFSMGLCRWTMVHQSWKHTDPILEHESTSFNVHPCTTSWRSPQPGHTRQRHQISQHNRAHTLDVGQQRRPGHSRTTYQWLGPLLNVGSGQRTWARWQSSGLTTTSSRVDSQ
jgi:hypothetical protein